MHWEQTWKYRENKLYKLTIEWEKLKLEKSNIYYSTGQYKGIITEITRNNNQHFEAIQLLLFREKSKHKLESIG